MLLLQHSTRTLMVVAMSLATCTDARPQPQPLRLTLDTALLSMPHGQEPKITGMSSSGGAHAELPQTDRRMPSGNTFFDVYLSEFIEHRRRASTQALTLSSSEQEYLLSQQRLMPQFSLGTVSSYTNNNDPDRFNRVPTRNSEVSVKASYPLINMSLREEEKLNSLRKSLASIQLDANLESELNSLVSKLYELALSNETLNAIDGYVTRLTELLSLAKARVESGQIAVPQLAELELSLQRAIRERQERSAQKEQLLHDIGALAHHSLTGLAAMRFDLLPDTSRPAPGAGCLKPGTAELLAATQILTSEKSYDLVRAGYLPTVQLDLQVRKNKTDAAMQGVRNTQTADAGVSLNWNFGAPFQLRNVEDKALAQVNLAKYAHEDAVKRSKDQCAKAYLALRSAEYSVQATQKELELAIINADHVNRRWKNFGNQASSIQQLVIAEDLLHAARKSVLVARHDLIAAGWGVRTASNNIGVRNARLFLD